MRRKAILPVLFVIVLMVGCGPAASPSSDDPANTPVAANGEAAAKTILQFAVSGFQGDRYSDLIDVFETENPDVHISVVSVEQTLGTDRPGADWPSDAYLRLAAAADVIDAPATREAVQQGALLDLSQLFESDPSLSADAFYPGLLESMQWDGKTWSVPTEASYRLLYFDKALFDAAGVAYPAPGWTWDDFLAAAQALTVRSGDTVSQWGFVDPTFDPVTLVQARAGFLFDTDTYPPTARLDDPAVVEAVRWYTDLFLTHEVSPYYSTSDEGGSGEMFNNEGMRLIENGQAAMWFTGTRFSAMRRGGPDQQQNTGVVPFPVVSHKSEDHSTPVTVDGLSVSAGTQKADLAWRWISFLVQQQQGQRGPFNALVTGTVPALSSVAAAGGFWDRLDEAVASALRYAIDHAYVDNYNGVGYDTFSSAVVDVMDNSTPVEAAMANAQSTVEAEIDAAVAAAPTPVADLIVSEQEQEAVNSGAVIIDFGLGEGRGRFGQQSLANLVDQFEAAHPGIVVETHTPQGFRGQLDLADLAAEYDCFQASPNLNDESVAAVVNIEPFLASDQSARKEDFFPSILEQFTYQGQLWGLPGSVAISLMNYNKDLFDAAQLPYPTANWTISDFLEMAVALTKEEGESGQYGYAPSAFGTDDLINIMDRLGADMLDESVDPPRLVFNSPDVAEAFRWYASLATQYKVEPIFDNTEDFGGAARQRQTLINEGRVAMWMDSGGGGFGGFGGGPGDPGGPGGRPELNLGVVPLPAGPNSANGSGFQTATGYFISAQSDARQACWTWITFLTEQPSLTSGLPARQSVAESADYRQRIGEERVDAYLASMNSGNRASFYQRISDQGNWLGFASFWLSDAYQRVVSGEMEVEESLAAAQESVNAYRDCIITNSALQDEEAMRQCLSESGTFAPGMP